MLRKTINSALALCALALGGCGEETSVSGLPAGLETMDSKQVFEPQVTILEDNTLALSWRERGESGSNIYASIRASDGSFGAPVRVNDEADSVESYAHDGMRAAIAVGSGQNIAIAWTDSRAQIRAAISTDGGASFRPSIRLDQAGKPAYRAYPAISFDSAGGLHAIWIDSRFADGGAEEPAVISGSDADGFSVPQAASNPLWELRGCPMAGPILADDEVLWHDGSTGKKLIMIASASDQPANPLLASLPGALNNGPLLLMTYRPGR